MEVAIERTVPYGVLIRTGLQFEVDLPERPSGSR